MCRIAAEQHNAGVKIVQGQRSILYLASREFLDCGIDVFDRKITRPGQAALLEFLSRPGVDEYGRPIDFENSYNAFQFNFRWAAKSALNWNSKLVSPHIRKPGGHQLIAEPFALSTIRPIAVKNQRLALVSVHQPLNRDNLRGCIVEDSRTGNMTSDVFGASPGIDDQGAAVDEDTPDLFRADFFGFLIGLGQRCLKDAIGLCNHVPWQQGQRQSNNRKKTDHTLHGASIP